MNQNRSGIPIQWNNSHPVIHHSCLMLGCGLKGRIWVLALLLCQQCGDVFGQLYTGSLLEVFNAFVIVMESINDNHSHIFGGHQV